jgi:5'-3' exonuclease
MGVPYFFGELSRRYPDIVKQGIRLGFDWVMPDTNGLIHPTCQEVMRDNPDIKDRKELEWRMACAIVTKLKWLVEFTNSKNMFIAIDGPPPMAKIKQQRLRRFKSSSDRMLKNSVLAKWKLPAEKQQWNTAAITPGTGFMKRLALLINLKIKREWFGEGVNVEFSSASEPGEGEHKIKDKINKLYKLAKKDPPKIAIHGLDADLIFLTMSSGCPGIHLMRESEQIYGKRHGDSSIAYVDMDLVRKYAVEMMVPLNGMRPIDVVRDWIALCYFLGNDFLPHFPSLSVKNNGLQRLVESYNTAGRRLVVRDGDAWALDIETVQSLAAVLAGDEVRAIRDYSARTHHRPGRQFRSFDEEWEAIQRLQPPPDDTVMVGRGSEGQWKHRYYNQYMGTDSFEEVYKMCQEYYRGLVWVTNYYFGSCPDWNWFYPSDYAPFVSDFARAKYSEVEFKNEGGPLAPGEQLLLCLPVFASELMPLRYRKLVKEGGKLSDLYPESCEEDLLWKSQHWQGIPKLPAFNPVRVLKEARKIDAK